MVCLKGMWGNFDDKENKAQNICLPAQSLQSLKPKQKKLLFFPLPKMEMEMKEMELPNFTIRPGYEALWKLKKANSIKSFQHQLSLLALPTRLVQSLKKKGRIIRSSDCQGSIDESTSLISYWEYYWVTSLSQEPNFIVSLEPSIFKLQRRRWILT